MDLDTVAFIDPLPVFKSCEYTSSGAVFFPDYWGHLCADHVWNNERALCGQSTSPEHVMWEFASAQWADQWPLAQEFLESVMFVDRVRHYNALQVALLISLGPMRHTLVGLKDILKFAWLTVGHEYTLSSERPAMVLKKPAGAAALKRTSPLLRFKTLFLFAASVDPAFNNTGVSIAVPKADKAHSFCLKVFQEYSAHVLESSHEILPLNWNIENSITKWRSFLK